LITAKETYERAKENYEQAEETYERATKTYEKAEETYERATKTYEKAEGTHVLCRCACTRFVINRAEWSSHCPPHSLFSTLLSK